MKNQTFRSARWALALGLVLAGGVALLNPESVRQRILLAREGETASELRSGNDRPDGATTPVERESDDAAVRMRRVTFRAAVERPAIADEAVDVPLDQSRTRAAATSNNGRPALFIESPNRDARIDRSPPPVPAKQTAGPLLRSPFPSEPAQRPASVPSLDELPAGGNRDVGSTRLESQLVSLRESIEQLSDARQREQFQQLERTTTMLAQLTQAQQLERLEQQLQQLQSGGAPKSANPAANEPKEATPDEKPAANEPQQEPQSGDDRTAAKPGVLNAQRAADGSERFSLQIQEAAITEVLEMLGQLAGTNILVGKGVTGSVSANLNEVTVDEALNALLRSHGYSYERDERFIYVMTAQEAKERKNLTRILITKVYRPHYISVKDLQALVTPLLTPTVSKIAITNPAESGIAPSAENAGGDSLSQRDALLVQDYQEVIDEIDNLMLAIDVPPLQVVIEAMILSVNLTDSMQFGVNFALLNNTNNNLFVSGNGRTLNNSSGFPGGKETIVPPMAEFIANTAGLKYGFIQGDMSAFIQALETLADTNTIASPQLRVLNKQKAELHIGDRLSYTTTTQNGTSSTENVNFMDVGTKLLIRPFISPDGLVRLEVHPERSSGQINAQTGLPDTSTTEVTTNVMVRDGTTVVIGGLIEEQVVESTERIPYLGGLPYVGKIFRNKSERLNRTELIVLITPRIVTEPDAEVEGDLVTYENERRADYFRNHLSPINRRNLARIHYEWALDHFECNELQRAKWHIDISLEQDKNNLEALRLNDQIDERLGLGSGTWLTPPWTSAHGADAPQLPAQKPSPVPPQPATDLDAERDPQASGPRSGGLQFRRRDDAATGPSFGTQAAPGRVVIRGQSPSR